MNIKVYGTGCPKCQTLMANVEAALKSTSTQATTEKVTDIDKIIARGIMTTPALEIDGEIVSSGRIMSADEIARRICPTRPSHPAVVRAETRTPRRRNHSSDGYSAGFSSHSLFAPWRGRLQKTRRKATRAARADFPLHPRPTHRRQSRKRHHSPSITSTEQGGA